MFFGFSFPKNRNRYIFFEPCEVLTIFPTISLAMVAFSLVSLRNVFQPIVSGVNRRVCVASFEIVSYIFADLGPSGELLTKQTSFLVQRYARLGRIVLRIFANLFVPATISLASLHETHVPVDISHFQMIRLRAISGQTESVSNGGHDRGWSARRQQLVVIMCIMTLGTIKKPGFRQTPKDSHPHK